MAVYYATKSYVLSFGRAIGHELRGTGVTITTLCPGATTSEFAQVANMQGSALFEGPVPVMTAAEVARQGYAALKAGRPQIITGPVNRIIAMSTRFTPTAILLMIAGRLNRRLRHCQTRRRTLVVPENLIRADSRNEVES